MQTLKTLLILFSASTFLFAQEDTTELFQSEDIIPIQISFSNKVLKKSQIDSIYFDTYSFNSKTDPQWGSFTKLVPKLLNSNGIYSYFNNNSAKIEKVEEIIESFGWEKHKKTIPKSNIYKSYELIWYINK